MDTEKRFETLTRRRPIYGPFDCCVCEKPITIGTTYVRLNNYQQYHPECVKRITHETK